MPQCQEGGSVPAKYFIPEKRKKQLECELVSDLQPFNSQCDSQYDVRRAHAEESLPTIYDYITRTTLRHK